MTGPAIHRPAAPAKTVPPDRGPLPGVSANDAGRGLGEYRCAGCGYGIVTMSGLPACPMCHGSSWEAVPGPFTPRSDVEPVE
jgi:hypothetical protein